MTKDSILKVATKEFSKYGYDAVSMGSLAAKLDINKATIYYYFKDKKSLYQKVFGRLIDENIEKRDEIANSNINPKIKFEQYIYALLDIYKKNPEIIPILQREMANFGSNLENYIEKEIEKEIINIRKILSSLNLKDSYKNIDPYFIDSIITGTTNTYYTIYASKIKLDDRKTFKNSHEFFDNCAKMISMILLDAFCKSENKNE